MKNIKSVSAIVLGAIIAVQLSLLLIFPPKNILSYDVFGYYLYLPQAIINNDLAIKDPQKVLDVLKKYKNSETFYQAFKSKYTGNYVIKYPSGMAICYLPWFTLAHLYVNAFDGEADGYSAPYQNAVAFGCFIYAVIGLIFLRKLLLLYFNEKTTSITLLTVFLATNYFAHVSLFGQSAMSHTILFTLYVLIIWFTVQWHATFDRKNAIALAVCIGIAALIRATEIISILIPLLYNVYSFSDLKKKFQLIKQHFIQVLMMGGIVFGIVFIQLLYFKIYAGKFIYNSYGGNPGEGFEFLHPYILQVLFSFRKGWIIYTPVIIFFIAGLFSPNFKKTGFRSGILLFSILNLYIVASWSCWWYAGSFGQRALIPAIACLCLPFASFVEGLNGKKSFYAIVGLLIAFASLNVFQTWQMANGIIDIERMTRPYYSSVFFQTKTPSKEQKDLLLIDRGYSLSDELNDEEKSKLTSVKNETLNFDTDKVGGNITDSVSVSGKNSLVVPEKSYSPAISHLYSELTNKYYLWVKISASYYVSKADTANKILLKAAMIHKGYEYKMREKENDHSASRGWHALEFYYLCPEIRNVNKDSLKVYIDNRSSVPIMIDDLHMEVFEPKENRSVF